MIITNYFPYLQNKIMNISNEKWNNKSVIYEHIYTRGRVANAEAFKRPASMQVAYNLFSTVKVLF